MDKNRIWKIGTMTSFVVAQLPLGTEDGQKALRLVVDSCMSACCKTEEEKDAFRRGMMFSSPEEEADFMAFSEEYFAKARETKSSKA
jgi:hypothetical protein